MEKIHGVCELAARLILDVYRPMKQACDLAGFAEKAGGINSPVASENFTSAERCILYRIVRLEIQ